MARPPQEKVVVTGLGTYCSIAENPAAYSDALRACKKGYVVRPNGGLASARGRPPELLAYLRYFNGLTSLEEFNNDCARRFDRPSLSLAPFMASLREVLSRDQVVRWQ